MSTQRPLKVVHVISSLKLGGAEQWLVDMVSTLHQHEVEQTVLYFHTGPHVDTLKKMGVECIAINGMLSMYDPWFFIRFWQNLRRVKPDIIHSSLWAANFVARVMGRIMGIPVINTYHSAIDHESVARRIIDVASGKLVSTAVFVADTIEPKMNARFIRSLPRTRYVIKNGINIPLFEQRIQNQSISRSELGISESTFVIGSVGRFVSVKNFIFLLDVAANLILTYNKNIHVVLVGAGPLEQQLRDHAQNIGIGDYVKFIIAQPAYRYYSLMDCFIQPSLQEGLSLALLEAMCAGLPCIVSTDTVGHSIIHDGKNGITVKSFDKQVYGESVQTLIDNYEYRIKLGCEAKKTVIQHHCVTRMVAEYVRLYQRVAHQRIII